MRAILAQAQQVGSDIVAELRQSAGLPQENVSEERSLQARLDDLEPLIDRAADTADRAEMERLVAQAKEMIADERVRYDEALSAANEALSQAIEGHGEESSEAAAAAEVARKALEDLKAFDDYMRDEYVHYNGLLEGLSISAAPVPEQPAEAAPVSGEQQESAASPSAERLQQIAEELERLKREFDKEVENIMSSTAGATAPREEGGDDDRERKAAELLADLKKGLVYGT